MRCCCGFTRRPIERCSRTRWWRCLRKQATSSVRAGESTTACFSLPNSPAWGAGPDRNGWRSSRRSEEHTSELQSRQYLVCRLLLEKKKKKKKNKVHMHHREK